MAERNPEYPKLRLIDAQNILYEGERYLALRDPLMLADKTMLVPQPFIPLLSLCDGTRTVTGIRASLAIRFGIFLTSDRIQEFISALDNSLLLENQRSQQARQAAHIAFRQAPFRTPSSAGQSYPDDASQLANMLERYIDQSVISMDGNITGLVSPHIDYARGGQVYARVWASSANAIRESELAIIFGTDHFSEGLPFSLTRQNYATPFGVLPTDRETVDMLADAIGVEEAFTGELHHRGEHSIELASVWLHYIRGENPISIVPILTGPFSNTPGEEPRDVVGAVLDVLSEVMGRKRTLVIAAGDLAHVGPAFDTAPINPGNLIHIKAADDVLIEAICQGDASGFYHAVMHTGNANNICGVSPIYMTLRLLSPLHGESCGYAVCPADENGTSFVTICGVTLHPI